MWYGGSDTILNDNLHLGFFVRIFLKKYAHIPCMQPQGCEALPSHFVSNFAMSSKVDMPTSATDLNETLIFLWYVIRCHSKKGYQKDMCLKNELHVQNMLSRSNLNSQPNWWDLYRHLVKSKIFILIKC